MSSVLLPGAAVSLLAVCWDVISQRIAWRYAASKFTAAGFTSKKNLSQHTPLLMCAH
jgi:hypothetical protein